MRTHHVSYILRRPVSDRQGEIHETDHDGEGTGMGQNRKIGRTGDQSESKVAASLLSRIEKASSFGLPHEE
jgi:hypothetical protein